MGYAIEETTPTSGGIEYTEDSASAADPSGSQLIARRRDTLAAETDANGDHVALNATNKGELYTKATDSDSLLTAIASIISSVIGNNGLPLNPGGKTEIVAGTDGTNVRIIKTDTSGELQVDVLTLPTLPAGVNRIGIVDLDSDATIGASPPGVGQLVAGTDGLKALALKTNGSGELQVGLSTSLPAGTNKIGGVDLNGDVTIGGTVSTRGLQVAGSDGTNARALKTDSNGELQVDVLTLPALPAGANKIGAVDLDSDATIGSAAPATGQLVAGTDGTNARGIKTDSSGELQIDVLTLPALPAGTNNIGDVDVLTLPADPLGANADAAVIAGNTGTISGKLRQISADLDAIKTSLQIMDDWDDTDKAKVSLYDSSLNGLPSSTSRPASNARGLNVRAIPELGINSAVYCFHTGSIVHVAAASTLMLDMFNADASLVVRILSIQHIVNLESAVTGVGFEWQLLRTTAVGTGGTSLTAWLADTNDTALDADITSRTKATGGATASTSLKWWYSNSEETLAGNQLQGGAFSVTNVLPQFLETTGKGLVLRQNQGIRINQETNSNAGNSAFMVFFTVE